MKLLHKLFLPPALKTLGGAIIAQIILIIASSIFGVEYETILHLQHVFICLNHLVK